jgi:hypothetical protein
LPLEASLSRETITKSEKLAYFTACLRARLGNDFQPRT